LGHSRGGYQQERQKKMSLHPHTIGEDLPWWQVRLAKLAPCFSPLLS